MGVFALILYLVSSSTSGPAGPLVHSRIALTVGSGAGHLSDPSARAAIAAGLAEAAGLPPGTHIVVDRVLVRHTLRRLRAASPAAVHVLTRRLQHARQLGDGGRVEVEYHVEGPSRRKDLDNIMTRLRAARGEPQPWSLLRVTLLIPSGEAWSQIKDAGVLDRL